MSRPRDGTTTEMRFISALLGVGAEDCWPWRLGLSADGYAAFRVEGRSQPAHRWSHERFVGPIPPDFQIDHLCRVRNCVNPIHLEAVSGRVNWERSEAPTNRNARKTHCVNGHPFRGRNLITRLDSKTGRTFRQCRICRRESAKLWRERMVTLGALKDSRGRVVKCSTFGLTGAEYAPVVET